ncbi:MAG: zinc ribbon domain-containing protein [Chloroflexi bacterium]|nr:zinc ribbon domain-containing protein [Chloroflexota bacterium]
MVTCPNCGNPVRETQQFCGNCGTDVHAALAAAAPPAPAADESASTPYAYAEPSGFDAGYQQPLPAGNGRVVIIGAAFVLVAAEGPSFGIVLGFEIIPDILGIGSGSGVPKLTPTPSSFLPLLHYLIG